MICTGATNKNLKFLDQDLYEKSSDILATAGGLSELSIWTFNFMNAEHQYSSLKYLQIGALCKSFKVAE